MEMDVKGVSPCPEPIPPAAGSGGCPHQRPHHRDGQPAEPAPAADSGHPERRHGSEKEDKKVGPLRRRPAGAAPAGGAGCPGPRSAGRAGPLPLPVPVRSPPAPAPFVSAAAGGGGRRPGLAEDTGAAARGAGPPLGPGCRALFRPPARRERPRCGRQSLTSLRGAAAGGAAAPLPSPRRASPPLPAGGQGRVTWGKEPGRCVPPALLCHCGPGDGCSLPSENLRVTELSEKWVRSHPLVRMCLPLGESENREDGMEKGCH